MFPPKPKVGSHVRYIFRPPVGFPCPNPVRPVFPFAPPDLPCDNLSTVVSISLSGTQTAVGTHATTVITYSGNHISVSNHTDADVGGSGVTTSLFSATDITVPTGYGVCASIVATTIQSGYQPFPTFAFQTGFRETTGGAGTTPGNIISASSPQAITAPNVVQPATWYTQGLAPPASTSTWKYVTTLQTVLASPNPSTTFSFEGDLSLTMFVCDQNFSHPLNNLQQVYTLPSPTGVGWATAEFCGAQLNPVSNGWDVSFNPTGNCYMRWKVTDAQALTSGFGCQTPRLNYDYTVLNADPTGVDINTCLNSLNQNIGRYTLWTETPTTTTGSITDTQATNYHPWSNHSGRTFCPEFLVGFSAAAPGANRMVRIRNPDLKGWTTS